MMTPALLDCVERSLAAERAGDSTAALEWHQSVPMFRRGRNRLMLVNLAALGDALPEWVWARWIVYQSTRCEDGDTGAATRALRGEIAEEWHGDALDRCFDEEGDPVQVLAQVMGESWAFQQLIPYEHGALVSFIDEFATGRLAEHAGLARRWVDAPMRGYELGASRAGHRLSVRDAAGGPWVDVLDLGARSAAPHGWVVGRLVPSGLGDLPMFDTVPLAVPRSVAVVTSGDDECATTWQDRLLVMICGGVLASDALFREDYELTSDVAELELLRFGTPAAELDRVMQQLRSGRDEISRAAYRVLERARQGDLAPIDHAYVTAAVVNVHAFDDMRRLVRRGQDAGNLSAWAGRLVEPAAGRLLDLVAP